MNEPDKVRLLGLLLGQLPGRLDRFAELCEGVEDWSALMSTAGAHGVDITLDHYLTKAGVELPVELEQRLRRQAFLQHARQGAMYTALIEALTTLDREGIRAVPLKGPILSERLYDEPFVRPSHDLDILVTVEEFERASAVLEAARYRGIDAEPTARYNLEHHHHVTLLHPMDLCHLELHFRAITLLGTEISARAVIDRAGPYTTATGAHVSILAPEDELLYLIAHAVGHFVVCLKWLLDIHLFLQRHPDLDWTLVLDRARSHELSNALAFCLGEIVDLFGTDIRAHEALPLRRWRRGAVGGLRTFDAAFHSARPVHTVSSILYSGLLCDRWSTAVRYLRHNVGRIARRRVSQVAPSVVPEDWAG